MSLNLIIDCYSNFGLLNSLFTAAWIYVIPAFGLSLECLMYDVSVQSYKALTSVSFLILSFMTPCASHTTSTRSQNWFGSSFPTPLNTENFIALTILNCGGGRGDVGKDGGEDGETSGGVDGGGMCIFCCLIMLITLLSETFASSSSLSHGGEIKGVVSNYSLPSFL